MPFPTIQVGQTSECTEIVTSEHSAPHIGSGSLQVYASPAMASHVERTCRLMAEADLEPGYTTVGTQILLRHLAPTPIGGTILVQVEVVGIEGNRIDFRAQVWDDHELVGEAEHRRVIIEEARFLRRVTKKQNA